MRHLGEALDQVRKSEYARLRGRDRSLIKGQKYTLLSNRDNLTLDGRRFLHKLLLANRRLNVAYLLKESFGQLWDYRSEAWARRFFENWKAALRWQRLAPYQKFAAMIDRHWDGIAAYCRPQNKVSLRQSRTVCLIHFSASLLTAGKKLVNRRLYRLLSASLGRNEKPRNINCTFG
jgi:hypothetical protein